MRDYMEPALREHLGAFVPEDERNFFWIAAHYDPMPLYTHFYHWWDLARMRDEPHPSPIRRGPLLYNIFDSRAEGLATGVEEMFMHAGLYDDKPRVARDRLDHAGAARGARPRLALRARQRDDDGGGRDGPRRVDAARLDARPSPSCCGFEQHLYLRQPGYGTSYVTGKYLLERLLAERGATARRRLHAADFFDELNAAGVIPVSLIRWQMTGNDDEIRALME